MADTKNEPPFYMVWNEETGQTHFKHGSYDSAVHESKRLARTHPGVRFYVLAAVGCARKDDVTFEEYCDPIPF